jgi:(heptosyl)LPS beta-1,4-glucosyltransferase
MEISAIVITKNESANIVACLQSLIWVDEVILVDSGSTDNTLELAAQFVNVTILTSTWLGYSGTKRVAVKHTNYDWVLWIDADEILSSELQQELESLALKHTQAVAYHMPRKTFFMGEWVKYTGWYPGRVIRLFNKHHCDFNNNILHEGIVVKEGARVDGLKHDILHYSYTSLYQYFHKMNAYGKYGAEELQRRGKKFHAFQLVLNPFTSFIKFYFFKKGFKDGKKGLIISIGSAFSNFIKYTNFYYLQKKP